ncbi:hypothetical protein HBH56_090780 [Parastagonospora nodorum]|uniref:F-box domain-containing protein n=2 Tax=Phaeosphaeria nodorum (strain SN15 / ATCC MYA-4574 / FGSC 10173) TaxID=321614 RepID=A0A7U2I018_PHANO|nr:hypothetical protein SNOG_04332 [Parastagonospora nodorum SN15]KAH3914552.1 hypothetical protein HBH56_090780 [Parastagonospora nodorum]EAT88092.1 hypothetical protein SNOG_04332 [Parastagonospora nodorum SN15]KAH3936107.1 hypothetical protein HBH54_025420 [Parastagonospora nodorum]KAH3945532.1 hypothetical protein HBH53_142520 [Parastagonospora nodorum]KAH3966643.1 hypothetical protein HBH51_142830 [Parastagonospora nodorum]
MDIHASVLNVPNELWDLTFSYLNMNDILNLSKTHRVFQHSARRSLYKRVYIPLQRNKDAQDFGDLQLFLELALESASFRPYVHELQLEYTSGFVDNGEFPRFHRRPSIEDRKVYLREISWIKNRTVQKLVASLPSLHTVTIYIKGNPCSRQLEQAFVRLLRVALHSCPVEIRLLCAGVYAGPITELAKVPRVTSIAFDSPVPQAFRGPPVRETEIEYLTHLGLLQNTTNLDLGYNIITDAEALGKLIRNFPKISSLTLWLRDTVSPAELARTLEPVDTLRTLHVRREHACFARSSTAQGLEPADFGSFKTLRELQIGSSAMLKQLPCDMPPNATTGFIWYFDQSEREAMFKHLPPHLDNLEIMFEWPNSIFAAGASYHTQFKELPESVKDKGFGWMKRLLEMGIPKVVLREKEHGCATWGRRRHGKLTKKMKLPKTVREKCVEAGVRLEVWLLEPNRDPKMVST